MTKPSSPSARNTGASGVRAAHDRAAPWWAAALVVLTVTGLATNWVELGPFWAGYVLDMTGPAWTYILIRGLYRGWVDNAWTRFFTPTRTLLVVAGAAFTVEAMQFMEGYESTFDPGDLLAYLSLLVPTFLVDRSRLHGLDAGQGRDRDSSR